MVPDTTFDAAPKITPSASRGKCGPVGPLPNLDRPPVIANAFDNSSTIRRGFDKGTITSGPASPNTPSVGLFTMSPRAKNGNRCPTSNILFVKSIRARLEGFARRRSICCW